jgi:hypothetical protein
VLCLLARLQSDEIWSELYFIVVNSFRVRKFKSILQLELYLPSCPVYQSVRKLPQLCHDATTQARRSMAHNQKLVDTCARALLVPLAKWDCIILVDICAQLTRVVVGFASLGNTTHE